MVVAAAAATSAGGVGGGDVEGEGVRGCGWRSTWTSRAPCIVGVWPCGVGFPPKRAEEESRRRAPVVAGNGGGLWAHVSVIGDMWL